MRKFTSSLQLLVMLSPGAAREAPRAGREGTTVGKARAAAIPRGGRLLPGKPRLEEGGGTTFVSGCCL